MLCVNGIIHNHLLLLLISCQKKSREESSGAGSGVEIIKNVPYSNGPGGNGQYTLKIYHIGSHLPSMFLMILLNRSILYDVAVCTVM